MNKEALRELRERVERATGPDRELDALLLREFDPLEWRCLNSIFADKWAVARADGLMGRRDACWRFAFERCPHFSSSVDAALGLVERCLGNGWRRQTTTGIQCNVVLWQTECDYDSNAPFDGRPFGHHVTEPLATLLALLSALEAQAE